MDRINAFEIAILQLWLLLILKLVEKPAESVLEI